MKTIFWLSVLLLFILKSQILQTANLSGALIYDHLAEAFGACLSPIFFYYLAKVITKSPTKGYAVGFAWAAACIFLVVNPPSTLLANRLHQTSEDRPYQTTEIRPDQTPVNRLHQTKGEEVWKEPDLNDQEYQNRLVESIAKRQNLDESKQAILREHMTQILPVLKEPLRAYVTQNKDRLLKLTEEQIRGEILRALAKLYDLGKVFLTPDEIWTNLEVEEQIRELLPVQACKRFVISGTGGLSDEELAEVEGSLYGRLPNDLYAAALKNQRKAIASYLKGGTFHRLTSQEVEKVADILAKGLIKVTKGLPPEQVEEMLKATRDPSNADPEAVCKLGQYMYETIRSLKGKKRELVLRAMAPR